MGLLDQLTKNLGSGAQSGPAAGGGSGALVQALMGMLAGGGLQQLIASFQQKGLGDVVGSWVSTGANRPVSPDQVRDALGPEQVDGLARQTGLDSGSVATQLSTLLPSLVDKLTPDGQVPESGALQDRLGGLLKGLL